MTFTIPDERLKGLPNSEREALMDVAIGLYKRDAVSLGRAAEVVGLRTPEFLNELQRDVYRSTTLPTTLDRTLSVSISCIDGPQSRLVLFLEAPVRVCSSFLLCCLCALMFKAFFPGSDRPSLINS